MDKKKRLFASMITVVVMAGVTAFLLYRNSDAAKLSRQMELAQQAAKYEECIVDRIYHNGYILYDLSEEEVALLDELISYTEAGRYGEYAVKLNAEYVQVWEELTDKYETNFMDKAHIAYNGYKIFVGDMLPTGWSHGDKRDSDRRWYGSVVQPG